MEDTYFIMEAVLLEMAIESDKRKSIADSTGGGVSIH